MKIHGLNEAAKNIHALAVSKGWWEEDRTLPEILMLCVSELSEALEEYRDGRPTLYCKRKATDNEKHLTFDPANCEPQGEKGEKPYGIAVELADCIIRILDYCGRTGIDIEEALALKHEYNKSRPHRHGGKKC